MLNLAAGLYTELSESYFLGLVKVFKSSVKTFPILCQAVNKFLKIRK